ncbi:MAG: HlyD family efflux transporter periplasmic adaptor subunit [Elusimicrobiota bacterium]
MKKTFAVVAAVLLVVGGTWYYSSSKSGKKRRDPGSSTVSVQIGPIEQSVDATGSVSPMNRVEIKPPVSGRIDKLLVDEGSHVTSGQIVAWMSSTDRTAILDAARAQGPAEFKKWEDAYKATPVVASLPGEVILRNVVVGEAVSAGSVIFAVADTLIVNAQVDESDIGKIKIGQKARIRLDAYPERPTDGKVYDILFEGKNVSNVITYGVKVRSDKIPPFFRSQMTANVSFLVTRKEDALLLPSAAVRDMPGGKRVVSLPPGPDGKPVTREVTVGIETDDQVEILDGIAEGEKVLLPRGKYVAQKAPESSPLSFMSGRNVGRSEGAAPKPKKPATAAAGK